MPSLKKPGAFIPGVTPTGGSGNKGYNDGPKVSMRNALTEIAQSDTIPLAENWLELLEAYEAGKRKAACLNFAAEGYKAAPYAEEICKWLFDDDEEEEEGAQVKKAAAYCLGKIGPAAGVASAKDLAKALDDKFRDVRAEAARALGLLGAEVAGAQAQKLCALAKEPVEGPGAAAAEALVLLGEQKLLGPFLTSPDPQARRVAIVEVARDPEARVAQASKIAENLLHKETTVRMVAVQASGEIGSNCSKDHVALLTSLRVKERVVKVRHMACQAMGKIGEKAIDGLLEFLRDQDPTVRHFASEVLGDMGGDRAADKTSVVLNDKDALVRQFALRAIGRMGECGLFYSALIAEHIWDEDFGARLAAVQALSDLSANCEAPHLGKLSEDKAKGLRQAAVTALAKMGHEGAAEVHKFMEDPDQAVRCAAVRVFSPLHSKMQWSIMHKYAPQVAGRLVDEDWRVRFEAARALGDMHAKEFAREIGSLWDYEGGAIEDNQIKRTAIAALSKMGGENGHYMIPFLDDADRRVREDAEREIAILGGVERVREMAAAAPAATAEGRLANDDEAEVIESEEELSEPD